MAKKRQGSANEAWVGKLNAFFAASGETVPEEFSRLHPCISVALPADDFARRTVEVLRGRDLLFRRGKEIGTVEENGEWEEMTPNRFRTWLPGTGGVIPFVDLDVDNGMPIKCGVPYDLACAVLASDELRTKTPEILAVNMARLPVIRDVVDERKEARRKGFRKIELLPEGYDKESKTYTVHQCAGFDENWEVCEARKWLHDLLKYFDWSDGPNGSRIAVQIAAMATVFCRGLFEGRSPMFLWNSNLPGSGKSRLSQLALEPVHGEAGASGWSPDNREEVKKELDAVAQSFAPYIWFDDVPKMKVASVDLNRWLTQKAWRCRVLGTKKVFNGPIRAATFMTGAQVELDGMLARRTLVIDLFPRLKARNRALPEDAIRIDDEFFASDVMRGKVLGALWALVRNWDDCGRPRLDECQDLIGESALESFESWSKVIPPMISTASFGNCLASFQAPDAGDTDGREFEELAKILITENALGRDSAIVTMEKVIATSRLHGLFVDRLGSLEDVIRDLDSQKNWDWKFGTDIGELPEEEQEAAILAHKRQMAAGWSDKKVQGGWPKHFRKAAVSGQYFQVGGAVWEFGTRESARKASFPITRVK